MSLFDNPAFDNHESVHQFFDRTTGLRAIVAIHSTALGPAAGGCRRWCYASGETALYDALRLAKGMTYKNALAGIPFGGGKCVLLSKPGEAKSPAAFRALGRAIDSLGGRYVTAEDVGVSPEDMAHIKTQTKFVAGLPQENGGVGGDPSPWTAMGVALGIETAVRRKLGANTLEGMTVAVQGLGKVGFHLCKLLADAGVHLVVADVVAANVSRVVKQFGAQAVSPDAILFQVADVLAPCALGAGLNARTIPKLKCKIVAGAANNQLETAEDAKRLQEQDVLFVPDYLINSGGIISIAREYLGGHTREQLGEEIRQIPHRLTTALDVAERTNRPPTAVADEMAEAIFAGGGPARLSAAGAT